jgi:hypothetical protein
MELSPFKKLRYSHLRLYIIHDTQLTFLSLGASIPPAVVLRFV